MKKIYTDKDKFPNPQYSESYEINYKYTDLNGYIQRGTLIYYAQSKNAHKAVQARHRKLFPDTTIISSSYQ